MILWAAAGCWQLGAALARRRGRCCGRLLASTGLAAAGLPVDLQRPHTVVTASEWVYKHIPSGSMILTQHWDEGFPLLAARQPSVNRYKIVEMPYYEPDTPAKMRKIADELARADYIAFQTKRLYGALTQAAEEVSAHATTTSICSSPATSGTRSIYEHASRPSLFGIEFPDELADESLTVYDHPKVLIFQNSRQRSPPTRSSPRSCAASRRAS